MPPVNLDDYVDVPTRLAAALDRWPDLRVIEHSPAIVSVGDAAFIQAAVTVYRSPDDPLPAVAHAWEPFPGRTPFTRDSEMMNASTSALGRALGMMGVHARRSLASREEVEVARSRQADPVKPEPTSPPERVESNGQKQQRYRDDTFAAQQRAYDAARAEKAAGGKPPSEKQLRLFHVLLRDAGAHGDDYPHATAVEVSRSIDTLRALLDQDRELQALTEHEEPF